MNALTDTATPHPAASRPPSPSGRGSAPLLELEGLTKTFGAFTALSAVDVAFRPGEVHCLLGENGAGKSTLCNLVFGVHQPDGGVMRYLGQPHHPRGPNEALERGIAMVHQHFSLVNDMSVVDNLLLGRGSGWLHRKAYAEKLRDVASEYGLPLAPFARVGDLSIGERQRVEIVKCLMREPRVLILDEPTAVLLPEEIQSLLGVCRRVAENGCAVILVTHKLAEIRSVADRVTVLRGGRVAATSEAPAAEMTALVKAMIQRDLGTLDSAMMTTLGMSDEAAVPAAAAPAARSSGPEIARIENLTVKDPAGATRLDGLSLSLREGEIVGLAGVEGNGQTELGLVLAGLLAPESGTFSVDGRMLSGQPPRAFTEAGVGIVPEDRHLVGAITGMSVADNLLLNRTEKYTRFGLLRRGAMREAAVEMMGRFDVRAAGPDVSFGSLSGGNQQKAVLGRELTIANLRFLLAAQPTRGLDVGAVEAVYGLIRAACAKGAAVLLISSEIDEIIAVAHRVVVLYRGKIVGECAAAPDQRETIGALMAGHAA